MIRHLAALSLILAAPALAADEDEQVWLNATAIGSLKGRLLYFAEVQPRFGDRANGLDQLLLRPALGLKVSNTVSLYGGYAYAVTKLHGRPDRREDRLFQQLSWALGKVAGGTLTNRTRLEQRRIRGFDDTGWRARSMMRFTHPLTDPAKTRALVWSEAFVALNDTDWGARGGFDQIRTFIGLEVPLPGRSTLDLGYLNQAIDRPNAPWRVNHVASITLWLRP